MRGGEREGERSASARARGGTNRRAPPLADAAGSRSTCILSSEPARVPPYHVTCAARAARASCRAGDAIRVASWCSAVVMHETGSCVAREQRVQARSERLLLGSGRHEERERQRGPTTTMPAARAQDYVELRLQPMLRFYQSASRESAESRRTSSSASSLGHRSHQ